MNAVNYKVFTQKAGDMDKERSGRTGGKKVLFIDRDGTLIKEHPPTYQIDSWDKLEFYPYVFTYLTRIANELDFELVMVSNQDGLGTDKFPEANFTGIHEHIITSFANEGVVFTDIHIDRSMPEDGLDTRKPGIGMLKKYFAKENYDLANSFVIGDRITDVQMAKNLGCKAIWLKNNPGLGSEEISDSNGLEACIALTTTKWEDIYTFLKGLEAE
jgi:imidazoleglycerol-phosphate dehydratase/histidinol-phosphatase